MNHVNGMHAYEYDDNVSDCGDNARSKHIHKDEEMNGYILNNKDNVNIINVSELGGDGNKYHDAKRNDYGEDNMLIDIFLTN